MDPTIDDRTIHVQPPVGFSEIETVRRVFSIYGVIIEITTINICNYIIVYEKKESVDRVLESTAGKQFLVTRGRNIDRTKSLRDVWIALHPDEAKTLDLQDIKVIVYDLVFGIMHTKTAKTRAIETFVSNPQQAEEIVTWLKEEHHVGAQSRVIRPGLVSLVINW